MDLLANCGIIRKNQFKERNMIKILFICHGNICRSPMAEFVMKDMVTKAGLAEEFHIESAATSTEEIGNDVYPPAKRKLTEKGIAFTRRSARQMTRRDYAEYDYLVSRFQPCRIGTPIQQRGKWLLPMLRSSKDERKRPYPDASHAPVSGRRARSNKEAH